MIRPPVAAGVLSLLLAVGPRPAVGPLPAAGPRPAAAGEIACERAASAAERTICGTPALRRQDADIASLYHRVLTAATGALPAALRANQRAWIAARARECGDADCLARRGGERRDALAALAARVSAGNPSLLDLDAVWLGGSWTPGQAGPADLVPASALPIAGVALTFRAGEMCVAGSCGAFGLERQRLADVTRGGELAGVLRVAQNAPFYLVYVDGRAGFGLVPTANGGLTAVSLGCAGSGDPCGWVRQVWDPARGGAAVSSVNLGESR